MVSIPFKRKIIIGLLMMMTIELSFLAKSVLTLVNDEGHQTISVIWLLLTYYELRRHLLPPQHRCNKISQVVLSEKTCPQSEGRNVTVVCHTILKF